MIPDFPLDIDVTLEILPGTEHGAGGDCGYWKCDPRLRRERTSRLWAGFYSL